MIYDITSFLKLLGGFIGDFFEKLNTVGIRISGLTFTYDLGIGWVLIAFLTISMIITVFWKGAKG